MPSGMRNERKIKMKVSLNNNHYAEPIKFISLPKGAAFFAERGDEPYIKISNLHKDNAFSVIGNTVVTFEANNKVCKYTIARLELEP